MRWSISIGDDVGPNLIEEARRWEGAGVRGVWTADHFDGPDPIVPLAALATSTNLHLGTLVINHDFWHPAFLARALGGLAQLAPGRVTFGVGAGHAEAEYRSTGISYERPQQRVDRMASFTRVAQRLLAGETVTHTDQWFTLTDCRLETATPAQRPQLLVGGNGDQVLAFGASHADVIGYVGFTAGNQNRHTNLSHFTWDGLADRIAHVRRIAGPRPLRGHVLVQGLEVTDDPSRPADLAQARGLPLEHVTDSPFIWVGSKRDLADRMDRLKKLGIDEATVFHSSAHALVDLLS